MTNPFRKKPSWSWTRYLPYVLVGCLLVLPLLPGNAIQARFGDNLGVLGGWYDVRWQLDFGYYVRASHTVGDKAYVFQVSRVGLMEGVSIFAPGKEDSALMEWYEGKKPVRKLCDENLSRNQEEAERLMGEMWEAFRKTR